MQRQNKKFDNLASERIGNSCLATEAVCGLAQAETSAGGQPGLAGQAETGGEAEGCGMQERQTGAESSSCWEATRGGSRRRLREICEC